MPTQSVAGGEGTIDPLPPSPGRNTVQCQMIQTRCDTAQSKIGHCLVPAGFDCTRSRFYLRPHNLVCFSVVSTEWCEYTGPHDEGSTHGKQRSPEIGTCRTQRAHLPSKSISRDVATG